MPEQENLTRSDTRHLHRRVLKTYWSVFLISLLAESVAFVIKIRTHSTDIPAFLLQTVLLPTLIQLGLLTANETAFRLGKERPAYFLVTGTCIASALVWANQSIHIQVLFLLSMLISLFYYNVKQLYIAYALNMSAFLLIFATASKMRENMSWYELFAYIFIMIGMVFILREAINRGMDILRDLTKMVKSEQELLVKNALMDRMVKRDPLTDLYNHKTFHQYFELLVDGSERSGYELQLAILDIDNFKGINDTYGHAVGDVILVRVAEALKEAFSANEIAARYGGEEFAVLFPGKSLEEAYAELEAVRIRIQTMAHAETEGRPVTVSIGLAELRKGCTKSDMFAEADSLLYVAKRTGKNRTVRPEETKP